MKTPAFWFSPPGLLARLLLPLSGAWLAIQKLRRRRPVSCAVPLIVVGNVVAGGAGKTPVTLALTRLLQARGLTVHLIAKGYGGKYVGPLQVLIDRHTSYDVGDEPLLLAAQAPTWIGADRGAAWQAAATGADVVISDDGLQNNRLAPTLSLLVMDGVLGIGNGCLIPAGPMREPLRDALGRVDAVIQIGGKERDYAGKPLVMADFQPRDHAWLRGARVLAFAGIGQPEKFFATLTTAGAQLVTALPFADHHPFSDHEIRQLIRQADMQDAIPVTTAKDAVRLPWNLREQIRVLEGDLLWRTGSTTSIDSILAPILTLCQMKR